MPNVFSKLNYKNQKEILILNAPEGFEQEISQLSGVRVARNLNSLENITFSLAFVTHQDELDSLAKAITQKAQGDAVIWFAYPKKSSKRYTCEFNRDSGWQVLGETGYEGVRQVAIDEDWSALRFRRTEFIKTLKRDPSRAMSGIGKKRTTKGDT